MVFEVDECEIRTEMDEVGQTNLHDSVISKIKSLCMMYTRNASDMISEWVAFASTKGLHGLDITLEYLDQMDREVLSKQALKTLRSTTMKKKLTPRVYTADTLDLSDGSIIDGYDTAGAIVNNKSQRLSQDSHKASLNTSIIFSPSSYSPASTKYSSRRGKGDVLCSHGFLDGMTWLSEPTIPIVINNVDENSSLQQPYQYMFEKLRDRCGVLNDFIEDTALSIQEKHHLEYVAHVGIPHPEEVNVLGRICCDGNGKLNANSIVLEGSQENSSGQTVHVDVSQLRHYSFFPGQIVAAKAINTQGTKLVLKSCFEEHPLNFSLAVPNIGSAPLDIVVAAGPFTPSDCLSYEPLSDLLNYIKEYKPNLCILIGPFVDCKHESIEKGDLPVTYKELFEEKVNIIINSLSGSSTELILIPSARDIHHHAVYPTPPFQISQKRKVKKTTAHCYCFSDPCLINVNGLIIGMTSVDILFHMGKEEIAFPPSLSDRLGRLTSHLINQHSFYPLYPPSESVNIDYENFDAHGKLAITPHILITPSDLRCFIKDIKGCCCINPERLAKGSVGGTFARVRIDPIIEDQYKGSVIDNIKAEIVRI